MIRTFSIMRHRRGVSLLEVLVVIAVIGVLMAMILPAVQYVRESARRTTCVNHLKEISLACHEHQETFGEFPGAIIETEPWYVRCLPYLEQQKPEISASGQVMGASEVSIFHCPSDPYARGEIHLGQLSYYLNNGHGIHRRDGFFSATPFRPVKPGDITDGTSNTVAIAEKLMLPGPQVVNGLGPEELKRREIRRTGAFHADYDEFADDCQNNSSPSGLITVGFDSYNHIQTPNLLSCTNGNRNNPESMSYMAVTASSNHPGGVNVGMADGAVRFIADSIDRNIWRSLGTRNGGETIGEW